jgi:patatin-like phospholipase/acyl hydrolase
VFHRSYLNPQPTSDIPDIKIWQAARATTAAPLYFKAMTVTTGDRTYDMYDGGMQANNLVGW